MKPIQMPSGESISVPVLIGLASCRFAIVLAVLLTAYRVGYFAGAIIVALFFVLRESIDIALANGMRAAGLITKKCPDCAGKDDSQ